MGYKYSFENLEVWKEARRFVVGVYELTNKMPSGEKFGLCSQIQRAAVSVVSNIAEGTSRISDREKLRFIEIAYGSLMEVYCHLCISLDLDYISQEQFDNQKQSIDDIARKLSGLKNSYEKRIKP